MSQRAHYFFADSALSGIDIMASAAINKLIFYSLAMLVLPIGGFFVSKGIVFEGMSI